MNKSDDTANLVVNEQLNRMFEQEKKRLELLPAPDFCQKCPQFDRGQPCEDSVQMNVMMKISILARLN